MHTFGQSFRQAGHGISSVCCALDMDRRARDKAADGMEEAEEGGWASALHCSGQVRRTATQLIRARTGGIAAPSRGARTGPGSARDRGAAGPPPSPVSRPQRRRPPCSSRERHQDLGGEQLAALARLSTFSWLPLPDGAWAQPLSVRPFAGRICPCLPRPSPSALLSRPFLPAELAFSALFLQAPPDCTRVPSAL